MPWHEVVSSEGYTFTRPVDGLRGPLTGLGLRLVL